jgi:hypothetical protein
VNAIGSKKNSLAVLERRLKQQGRRPRIAVSGSLGSGSAADVQRLIALVKGKPRDSGLSRLAKLERASTQAPGAQAPDSRPQVVAQSYDVGAPIRGRGTQPASSIASAALATRHWFLPDERDNSASSFAVELFEEVSLPSTNLAAEGGLTTGPTAELTVADTSGSPGSSAPTFTAAGDRDAGARLTLAAAIPRETPLGLDLAATAEAGRAEDADQFEREVQSILSGMKKRPPPPPLTGPSIEPTADAQSTATSPPRPHEVFERMGQNMAFANSFHLPAVELSKRLDALEAEVAREENAAAHRLDAVSLELSDEEVAASLGLAPDAKIQMPLQPAPLPAKPGEEDSNLGVNPICPKQPSAPAPKDTPKPAPSATPLPALAAEPPPTASPAANDNTVIPNPLVPLGATT